MVKLGNPIGLPDGFGHDSNVAMRLFYQLAHDHLSSNAILELKEMLVQRNREQEKAKYNRGITREREAYIDLTVSQRIGAEQEHPEKAIMRACTEGILGGQITPTVSYPPLPHPTDDHVRHLNDPSKAQSACPGCKFEPANRWWESTDEARFFFGTPAQQSSAPVGPTVPRAIPGPASSPSPIPADPHAPDAFDYPTTSQLEPQPNAIDGSTQTGPSGDVTATIPPLPAGSAQSFPSIPSEVPLAIDTENEEEANSPLQSDDQVTRAIEVIQDTLSTTEDIGEPLQAEAVVPSDDPPADRPHATTPHNTARMSVSRPTKKAQPKNYPDSSTSTSQHDSLAPQSTPGRNDLKTSTSAPHTQPPQRNEPGTAIAQPRHEPQLPADRQYSKGPMHGHAPRKGEPAASRSRRRHKEPRPHHKKRDSSSTSKDARSHKKKRQREHEEKKAKPTPPTTSTNRHTEDTTGVKPQPQESTDRPGTSALISVTSKRTGDAAVTSKQPKAALERSRGAKKDTKKKRSPSSPPPPPRLDKPKFTRGGGMWARPKPQLTDNAARWMSDLQGKEDEKKRSMRSVKIPKRGTATGGTNQPPARSPPPKNERPQKSIVHTRLTTAPLQSGKSSTNPLQEKRSSRTSARKWVQVSDDEDPADHHGKTPHPQHETKTGTDPLSDAVPLPLERSIQTFRELGEVQIWIRDSIQRRAAIEAAVTSITMPHTEWNQVWQPTGIHYPHERPPHTMVPFALVPEPQESFVSMAEQEDQTGDSYAMINRMSLHAFNRTRKLFRSDPAYVEMAMTLKDPAKLKGRPRVDPPTKNVCANFLAPDLADTHDQGKKDALNRARERDPNTGWTDETFPRMVDLHLEWAAKTSPSRPSTIQVMNLAIERFRFLAGGMNADYRSQETPPPPPDVLMNMVKGWHELFQKAPLVTADGKQAYKLTRQYLAALLQREVITTQDVDSLMAIDHGAIYRVLNNISEMGLYLPGAAFFAAEPMGLLASSYQYIEDTAARIPSNNGSRDPSVAVAQSMTHNFMEILDAADVRLGNLATPNQTQPDQRLRHVASTGNWGEVKPRHEPIRAKHIQARSPLDPLAEIPYLAGPYLMTCPLQGFLRDFLTLAIEIGFDKGQHDMRATALRLHAALSTGEAMNAYEVIFMWAQVKTLLNAAVRNPRDDSQTSHLRHALFNIFVGVAGTAPDCCLITRMWHRQFINMIMSNPQVFTWFMALPTERPYQLSDSDDKHMYVVPKGIDGEPEMQLYSDEIANATIALVKRSLEDLVQSGNLPPWVTGLQVFLTRALDDDWDEHVNLRKVKYESVLHTFACHENFYHNMKQTAEQVGQMQRYTPMARFLTDPDTGRPCDVWGINDQQRAMPANPEENPEEPPAPPTASSTPTRDAKGTLTVSPRVTRVTRLPPIQSAPSVSRTDAAPSRRVADDARMNPPTTTPRVPSEEVLKDLCRNIPLRVVFTRCDEEPPAPVVPKPVIQAMEPDSDAQAAEPPPTTTAPPATEPPPPNRRPPSKYRGKQGLTPRPGRTIATSRDG